MKLTDTIYATSSGIGRAAIAVVRVSGPRAKELLGALAGTIPEPRRASVRKLAFKQDLIDEAVVLWFPGPATATGEDIAEFHTHGSPAVLARLFAAFSEFDNVIPALPGEFTKRAFENGRLDLTEVEGLADLLIAEGEGQRRLALRQFLGENSRQVDSWRERILRVLALVEASIDFADDDAEIAATAQQVGAEVEELVAELGLALEQSAAGVSLRSGLKLVIAGAPNVGKSSLFNALLQREAAIVSPQAGTTRDVVTSGLLIAGLPVILADTAGLRVRTSDDVEIQGMARSRSEISDADILVWVRATDSEETVGPAREPDLLVINKCDLLRLGEVPQEVDAMQVSVLTGQGIDQLREAISQLIGERYAGAENAVLVRERHRSSVVQSIRHLNEFLNDRSKSAELRAEDLRLAGRALAMITGRVDVEDLLGKIFSEFCIGK